MDNPLLGKPGPYPETPASRAGAARLARALGLKELADELDANLASRVPTETCHGYPNGCQCRACRRDHNLPTARYCVCDEPFGDADCMKCGKSVRQAA